MARAIFHLLQISQSTNSAIITMIQVAKMYMPFYGIKGFGTTFFQLQRFAIGSPEPVR